jgi:hypothetical protein
MLILLRETRRSNNRCRHSFGLHYIPWRQSFRQHWRTHCNVWCFAMFTSSISSSVGLGTALAPSLNWNQRNVRSGIVVSLLYSAYNHKRATAAKCRESHYRRHHCTLAIGERHSSSCIRSAVVWLTAFCSGGALMIVRTVFEVRK